MNKKIQAILKDWLLYTLLWTVTLAILWPIAILLLGLFLQLFPSFTGMGESLLSIKVFVDAVGKGALMGVLGGFFFYSFSLIPLLSRRKE